MRRLILLLWLLLAPAGLVQALELKGVTLPDRISLPADGGEVLLNGAGVRSKFFVSVYVGALYLPAPRRDAGAVLASVEPRRVAMHFVYDRVEAHKLRDAWEEGFVRNQVPADLEGLRERLERFKALFADAVEGDVVWLDFIPGRGTRVSFNGSEAGIIEGDDFNRALLAVWLGEQPVDRGLKRGMLGE